MIKLSFIPLMNEENIDDLILYTDLTVEELDMFYDILAWMIDFMPGEIEMNIEDYLLFDTYYDAEVDKWYMKIRFFTETCQYYITVNPRQHLGDRGYLGCTYSLRTPYAGEDWNRGGDLPDGDYSYETFLNMMKGILGNEIVMLDLEYGHGIAEEV